MAAGQAPRITQLLRYLEDYLHEGTSLGIFVAGKTGVGKSSLINSIYGAEITKEAARAASVTQDIVSFTACVPTPFENDAEKHSTLTVWDSAGFGDVFASNREKLIRELIYVVDKAHILLYCFDIRGRLTDDDAIGLIEITRRVHPDIWKNTVFVLTFANELKPPPGSDVNRVEFFHEVKKSWEDQIKRVLLEKANVPHYIINNIAIVASGYRNVSPPGCENWFTSFWKSIFERIRDDGQSVLLRICFTRLVDNMHDPDLSELECQSPQVATNPCALPIHLYDTDSVQRPQHAGSPPDDDADGVQQLQHAGPPPDDDADGVQQLQHAGPAPDDDADGVQQLQHAGPPPDDDADGVQQLQHAGPPPDDDADGVQQLQHAGPPPDDDADGVQQLQHAGPPPDDDADGVQQLQHAGPPPDDDVDGVQQLQHAGPPPDDDVDGVQQLQHAGPPPDDPPTRDMLWTALKYAGIIGGCVATGAIIGIMLGIPASLSTGVACEVGVIHLIIYRLEKYIKRYSDA